MTRRGDLVAEAGWEVWLAADLKGSYEELPPTLIDYAKRDRRWCQGTYSICAWCSPAAFRLAACIS